MSDTPATAPEHALIFSDGACSKNPGPGGWGVVAYFPHIQEVIELGGGAASTTNNLMELESATQALELCEFVDYLGAITLCSDSKYVIQGITQWIWGWKKNGWKKADGSDVAGHGPAKSSHQIVDHHDAITGVEQRQDRMTADVAGAPRNQNRGLVAHMRVISR